MKREKIFAALTLTMLLALTACGGDTAPEDSSAETELPAAAQSSVPQPAEENPSQDVASQTTDQALLAIANDMVMEQYGFVYGFQLGAYFEQSWEPLVEDGVDVWFPVIDSQVQSLEDIQAYVETMFARGTQIQNPYQMINGVLCTPNMGIGDDMTLDTIRLETVLSHEGSHAVLQGWAYRWADPWDTSQPSQRSTELKYSMTYEDDEWKCSGFEWLY